MKLCEAAKNAKFKEELLVPNGTHNETWHLAGMSYVNAINDFKAKALREMSGQRLGGDQADRKSVV